MIRALILVVGIAAAARAAPVDIPRGLNHEPYELLLRKYVNERGLVDYKAWKASAGDMKALHDYTASFSGSGQFAESNEKAASLINAYNALIIQWILDSYPTKSIKSTSNPWSAKRHNVGGRQVSLDEIEQDTLRPLVGYRIHATLVCAAKSCPPLRAGAYTKDKFDEQLDAAMRHWLAREDLNRFLSAEKRVELSKIFSWYGKDFEKADGGVRAVMTKFAPEKYANFLKGKYSVGYLPYNWSLNEQ